MLKILSGRCYLYNFTEACKFLSISSIGKFSLAIDAEIIHFTRGTIVNADYQLLTGATQHFNIFNHVA